MCVGILMQVCSGAVQVCKERRGGVKDGREAIKKKISAKISK